MIIKRKKILIVVSGDLWGGVEEHVYLFLKELYPPTKFEVKALLFNDGLLYRRLKNMGYEIFIVDEKKNNIFSMIFKTFKILKHNKFNVIHCHGYKENFIAGIISVFSKRVILVRTHHGRGVISSKLKLHNLIEILNAHMLTDVLISVSSNLRLFLKEKLYYNKKIDVILNGIDCKFYQKDKENLTKKNEEEFILGSIGRLVPVKGYEYLIESIHDLVRDGYKMKLILVGDGPLLNLLIDKVNDLNLQKSITFTGFVKDVIPFFQKIDAFILPSLHEGIPYVILQAMCFSLPIVATKVGGITEVISHNRNGILVEPKNVAELSEAIKILVHDKELRCSLGRKAKESIGDKFLLENMVIKTLSIYEGQ